jgi:hypothetical protein
MYPDRSVFIIAVASNADQVVDLNIAPKHVVPLSAYTDPDAAIERALNGEAESAESEGELSDNMKETRRTNRHNKMQGVTSSAETPRKPRAKSHQRISVTVPELDSDGSLDLWSPTNCGQKQVKAEPPSPSITSEKQAALFDPDEKRRSSRRATVTNVSSDSEVEFVEKQHQPESLGARKKGKAKAVTQAESTVDVTENSRGM